MNVVCIGAHPDDAEFHAGGAIIHWLEAGAEVALVSLTNGDIGHHEMAGGPLARRRAEEVAASSRRAMAAANAPGKLHHHVLDFHDGELFPSLDLRKAIVRLLRQYDADLVLSHRPCDYHPDHRYTAMAVQDAAFMVTVPHFCPDTPALRRNPVFMYMMDAFTKPAPFQPDVAVNVDPAIEAKWDMLDAMPSQFYEWLPWLDGYADQVPEDTDARRAWLAEYWGAFFQRPTEMARPQLAARYGHEKAAAIRFAELFEICEYGTVPSPARLAELFPF